MGRSSQTASLSLWCIIFLVDKMDRIEEAQSKKLSPEMVVDILKNKGTDVTIQEAEAILKFITNLAHVSVIQYIRGCH
ncbi:hypothetical protein [Sphingobacterium hungaricum]